MHRDIEKHLIEYQSQYTKVEYCKRCGRQVKPNEWQCPNCGFWIEAHEGITTDEEETKKIRDEYDKRRAHED